MKKFVNDPANFVHEMLEGLALANPKTLKWVPEHNIIYRADAPNPEKVSVIQGSGSGHEPAHVMVVGRGMLDAACPGNVFAAPPMDYVLACTRLLNSPKGVLHLINNYQGDRMCWDMAREVAEAEGIKIATVIIDDDVSVENSTYTTGRPRRRGKFLRDQGVRSGRGQGPIAGAGRRDRQEGQFGRAHDGPRPHRLHAARPPKASRSSSWVSTRSKLASAFTASRAAAAKSCVPPTRWWTKSLMPSRPIFRSSPATRSGS